MDLFGLTIPTWALDWSGSAMVAISLWFLWHKRQGYWHWSNASLVPYFALFLTTGQFMLAGLQVSYLIFGIHGLLLWRLERLRRQDGRQFAQRSWYAAGWIISLGIFLYTVSVTSFSDSWTWLEFAIVSASLLANMATTRTWLWSWYLWIMVNIAQAVYFSHLRLWGQFALQFVLGAMSIEGARRWRLERERGAILAGPLEAMSEASPRKAP